jgi:hypothetical protein
VGKTSVFIVEILQMAQMKHTDRMQSGCTHANKQASQLCLINSTGSDKQLSYQV